MRNPFGAFRVPLLVLALSLLLSGCDGGLFGTGDPTIDSANTEGAVETGDGSSGVTAGGDNTDDTDAGDAESDELPPASTAPAGPVSLNNAVVSTLRDDAVVQVFNFTGADLGIDVLLADDEVIASASVSGVLTVPTDTDRIDVTDTNQPVAAFAPVTLAEGSATGILLRSADESVNGDAVVFVIRSQAGSESTAQVRAILAGALDTPGDTGETRLVPAGDSPAGAEVLLPPLSFDNPVGDYVAASIGDYNVQSALTGVREISFEAGSSYTLVLNPGAEEDVLQVLVDSDIDR